MHVAHETREVLQTRRRSAPARLQSRIAAIALSVISTMALDLAKGAKATSCVVSLYLYLYLYLIYTVIPVLHKARV